MDVISAEAQTGLRGAADSPENRDGDGALRGEMGEIRRRRNSKERQFFTREVGGIRNRKNGRGKRWKVRMTVRC